MAEIRRFLIKGRCSAGTGRPRAAPPVGKKRQVLAGAYRGLGESLIVLGWTADAVQPKA